MAGYAKRIAIIKTLKKGFSADGGELSGLVKCEVYAGFFKAEVSLINFAPLSEGCLRFGISDGKTVALFDDRIFEAEMNFDLSGGFAALVCFCRNNEVCPVASAVCGDMTAELAAINRRMAEDEGLQSKKETAYEDEAIAEVNYYELEAGEGGGTLRQIEAQEEVGRAGGQDEARAGDDRALKDREEREEREERKDRGGRGKALICGGNWGEICGRDDRPSDSGEGKHSDEKQIDPRICPDERSICGKACECGERGGPRREQCAKIGKDPHICPDERQNAGHEEVVEPDEYRQSTRREYGEERANKRGDESGIFVEHNYTSCGEEYGSENANSEMYIRDSANGDDYGRVNANGEAYESNDLCGEAADPRLAGGDFYERMSGEIKKIFAAYPAENRLERVIDGSRWAKINYGGGRFYAFGVIYAEGRAQYLCYGVPVAEGENCPQSLKGRAAYIPVEGGGFWVMYQDARTGISVRLDVG